MRSPAANHHDLGVVDAPDACVNVFPGVRRVGRPMISYSPVSLVRADVETNSPRQTTNPLPKLPENIVSALEKARDDSGKHVGHLRRDDFTTIARLVSRHAPRFRRPPPWKLPLRLRRNEPLNFGLFPRAVDKSPQTGIELSAEEDEEESAAFWRYPPVSTPCTELFRDPA
jgi:hypothetical protein